MMLSSELEFSKPHSASGFHAALVPILRKYCLKHNPADQSHTVGPSTDGPAPNHRVLNHFPGHGLSFQNVSVTLSNIIHVFSEISADINCKYNAKVLRYVMDKFHHVGHSLTYSSDIMTYLIGQFCCTNELGLMNQPTKSASLWPSFIPINFISIKYTCNISLFCSLFSPGQ